MALSFLSCVEAVQRSDFGPLHMVAALALPKLYSYLLKRGVRANLTSRFSMLLYYAIRGLLLFTDASYEEIERCALGSRLNIERSSSARRATVQVLLDAGVSAAVAVYSPFRRSSILRLALQNLVSTEDHKLVINLISAGAITEDEDLEALDSFWKAVESLTRKSKSDSLLMRLVDSLHERATGGARGLGLLSRVYEDAKQLQKELTLDLVSDLGTHRFLASCIKENDVARLEEFI